MSVRIDWNLIKADIEQGGVSEDAPFLFVLPNAGRSLLMSVIDVLKWKATYSIEDYDFADWDWLQSIVEQTHYGLMDGESMKEIAEAIRYLADKYAAMIPCEEGESMEQNQTVTVNACCCDGVGKTTVTTGTNDPPEDYQIPDITPSDDIENIVSDGDKCDRATYTMVTFRNACLAAVQNMEGGYDAASSWFDGVIDWMGDLFPNRMGFDLYLRMKSWVNSGSWENTEVFTSAFDPNFDAMVCAIFKAQTPSAAKTAVRSILEDFVFADVGTFAKYLYKDVFELMPFEPIFDADMLASLPPGYQDRVCCGGVELDGTELLPEIKDGYEYIPTTYVSYDSGDEPSSVVGDGNKAIITWKDEADNPWGVGVTVNYDVSVPELEGKQHVGFIVWVESNVLPDGRHVDVLEDEFWGNAISGSNEHADVELSAVGGLYYISVYAFGEIADDIGALMGELGDRNNTGTFRDGSFTTYGNMYTSQNDSVAGELVVRTWHIVRDAE